MKNTTIEAPCRYRAIFTKKVFSIWTKVTARKTSSEGETQHNEVHIPARKRKEQVLFFA